MGKSPQKKGVVLRLRLATPKKPNSARRPTAKIRLCNLMSVVAHIPGYGHTLRRHCRVLVCGVGARDLPQVNFSCIRGKYDFEPLYKKSRRRSIYGVKCPSDLKVHVRRKFRKFI